MNESALYKMQSEPAPRPRAHDAQPIYVSVRSGNAACPAIDMSAIKGVADRLQTTLEELDGACG